MRTCIRCRQTKDESEFNWRNINKGYLQSVCKTCQAEQGRERYSAHSRKVKEINRASRLKMIEEARQFIYKFLLASKCVDCGVKDVGVLTFHHVDPQSKRMNIADMVTQGYALATIERELARCIVLCHNCHVIRENKKRGGRFGLEKKFPES